MLTWIDMGQVAENMSVWRCLAHIEMIRRMSFSNPVVIVERSATLHQLIYNKLLHISATVHESYFTP